MGYCFSLKKLTLFGKYFKLAQEINTMNLIYREIFTIDMKSIYKFNLNTFGNDEIGNLVPIEHNTNIPFEVKRIFYTCNVPFKCNRGSHSYYNTEQVLICISGNLKIKCFDGISENIYELNSPYEALYISPKVWRTTFEHSPDAVLLVLSSLEYDENDYIRDYNEFLEVVKCT